jgi:hypothetical protein
MQFASLKILDILLYFKQGTILTHNEKLFYSIWFIQTASNVFELKYSLCILKNSKFTQFIRNNYKE